MRGVQSMYAVKDMINLLPASINGKGNCSNLLGINDNPSKALSYFPVLDLEPCLNSLAMNRTIRTGHTAPGRKSAILPIGSYLKRYYDAHI